MEPIQSTLTLLRELLGSLIWVVTAVIFDIVI
jgi:hypothetical protein